MHAWALTIEHNTTHSETRSKAAPDISTII